MLKLNRGFLMLIAAIGGFDGAGLCSREASGCSGELCRIGQCVREMALGRD